MLMDILLSLTNYAHHSREMEMVSTGSRLFLSLGFLPDELLSQEIGDGLAAGSAERKATPKTINANGDESAVFLDFLFVEVAFGNEHKAKIHL